MRVELALIVGIVFFCCWCAYIIVRMNSSVTVGATNNNLDLINNEHRARNNFDNYHRNNYNNNVNDLFPNNNNNYNNNNNINTSSPSYRYNNFTNPNSPPGVGHNISSTTGVSKNNRVPITTAATIKAQVASPYYYPNGMLYNSQQTPQLLRPFNGGRQALIQPLSPSKPPYSAQTSAGSWPQQHVAAASSQNWRDYSSVSAAPQGTNNNNNLWRSLPQANNIPTSNHQRAQLHSPYFSAPSSSAQPNSLSVLRLPLASNNQQYIAGARWQPASQHYNQTLPTRQYNLMMGQRARPMLPQSRQSSDSSSSDNTDESEDSNSQDNNPDPDADSSAQENQESSAPADGGQTDDVANSTGAEEPEQLNKELEEQNGERSYSEDQSDANERDRDGNPIVTHREHLINGRPVEEKGNEMSGSSSSGDFDKITAEIDDDNNQANDEYDDGTEQGTDENQNSQQQQESRPKRVIQQPLDIISSVDGASKGLVNLDKPLIGVNKTLSAKLLGFRKRDKKGRKKKSPKLRKTRTKQANPKRDELSSSSKDKDEIEEVNENSKDPVPKGKERESHEHNMKESLTAQHWDDDSASSPQAKAKQDRQELEEQQKQQQQQQESNDEEQNQQEQDYQQASEKEHDQDQEEPEETGPQQVDEELKELDMTVDPEKFMQSERRKKKRRKRQVSQTEESNQTLSSADTCESLRPIPINGGEANKTVPDMGPNLKTIDDDEQVTELIKGEALENSYTTTIQPTAEDDIVSEQEDINVEVIADPNGREQQPSPPVNNDFYHTDGPNNVINGSDFGDDNNQMTNIGSDRNTSNHRVIDQATYNNFYNSLNQPSQEPAPPLEAGDLAHNNGNQQQMTGGANNQLAYQPIDENQVDQQNSRGYPLDYHSTRFASQGNQHYDEPTDHQQPGHQPGYHHNQLEEPASDALVGPIRNNQMESGSAFALNYPLQASSSKSKNKKLKKKKKNKKKFKKSKMTESKYKAAKAIALKKKSKSRKGGGNKKKKKAKKKFAKTYKEFSGKKEGKKKAKGGGQQGGNKGALYYKDKGYKKRGFKKAYQKLETGDHKTYFDEFRDKDHNKKWKNFKDKHNYSQKKHWTGKDDKKYKNMHLNESKNKKYGIWRDKAATKYKKASKSGAGSEYTKKKKLKKKKKKSDYEFE